MTYDNRPFRQEYGGNFRAAIRESITDVGKVSVGHKTEIGHNFGQAIRVFNGLRSNLHRPRPTTTHSFRHSHKKRNKLRTQISTSKL